MKHIWLLLPSLFVIIFAAGASAQISNLKVDGSSTSFTMTSGDTVSWSYNVSPAGARTTAEIWYDVNANGTIDPGTDVLWQTFAQTDGDTVGNNGPPDMDGQANGAVMFVSPVGLAPGHYVMKFTEGGTSLTVAGTANPLSSPAHVISGTITVPAGKSAANIFVEAHRSEQYQPNFWEGITNSSGNYTIAMNSDTAGNPWQVDVVSNPYPPSVISPSEQSVTVTGNPSGINFSLLTAAAQIAGTLRDENGNLLAGSEVDAMAKSQNNFTQYTVRTDANGVYQIGFLQSDINLNAAWGVTSSNEGPSGTTQNLLDANAFVPTISTGDSIVRNLVVYSANSTITGTATVNGSMPGFPIRLMAYNQDTAESATVTDAATGNFSFAVSNKVSNYQIVVLDQSQAAPLYVGNIVVHPGETGVAVPLSTTTGVKEISDNRPADFSLSQNYPNPFNPTTVIGYQISTVSDVTLKIYDVLGREVRTLVSERQSPGTYAATFDATGLPSGVYLYRLQAGSFSETRRLVFLK